MEITDRQQWLIMRDLVSENNTNIKNVFSTAVCADVYDFYYRKTTAGSGVPKQTVEAVKSYKISKGIREIYKACADVFLQNDFSGANRYLDLQALDKNWLDELSTTDLFYYYSLQSKVLRKFSTEKNLNVDSAVDIISGVKVSKYFSGKVEFSGKPEKVAADKNKIDLKDIDLRAQVLHDIALAEHTKFCEENGINPDKDEEFVMTNTSFGKYSGQVANRYFKQREFLQQQREEAEKYLYDQAVLEAQQPKWVGFDEQYSPLYALPDGKYQTSTGEDYSGPIFELVEDNFVVVGTTENEDYVVPTDESDFNIEDEQSLQCPLNKRDLAPFEQTTGSEEVQ